MLSDGQIFQSSISEQQQFFMLLDMPFGKKGMIFVWLVLLCFYSSAMGIIFPDRSFSSQKK